MTLLLSPGIKGLITAIYQLRPEGHRDPGSVVKSLNPAERLMGFEPVNFPFAYNTLIH